MKKLSIFITIIGIGLLLACQKSDPADEIISNEIFIDSLTASFKTVKAWDTTTIQCYAYGNSLTYSWECDHGNFNGSGTMIKYAAGECCVGMNTIICTISNSSGQVSKPIEIEVTSYFGGGGK